MEKNNWLMKQGLFLSIIAALAAILSFVKEVVFANYFGVSEIADAYTVAIQVPEILFAVVWEAIHAVVVPLYTEKLYAEGKKGATRFISNLATIVCVICISFILFGEVFTSLIVKLSSPGLSEEAHDLAVSLMRWILPMLFFEGVIRICTGVLNVHKQFVIPRILTVVRNVGVIVFLFVFANKFGVYAAAFGVLCGIIIECVLCFVTMLKKERFSLVVDLKDPALKKAASMVIPLVVGTGIAELNQIADKIVASFLSAGSISSLNYASKLSSIIQVVLLSNIITVIYPSFSKLAAQGKLSELIETYLKTLRIAIMICIPIIFGGVLLKTDIVSLAFERGTFQKDSVNLVANLFSVYLIAVMFTTVTSIGVKLLASCCNTKSAAINSSVGVVINIILNVVLSMWLGAVGLVIATLISSIIVCVGSVVLVNKKVYKFNVVPTLIAFIKTAVCGAVMFIVLYLLRITIFANIASYSTLAVAGYCLLSVVVGAIVYAVMLIVFRVDEAKGVFDKIWGLVKKKNNNNM